MDWLQHYLLTFLIFTPLIGAVAIPFVKGLHRVRWVALGTAFLTLALSLLLILTFDWRKGGDYAYAVNGGNVQMVHSVNWIPAFHIQYKVGIDGLSFPLILLTTFISVLACLAAWKNEKRAGAHFALFLFLETTVLGTLLSLDFFLFYIFFELSLLPMCFLLNMRDGPNRKPVVIKILLYALVGSICLPIVMISTYSVTHSFDLIALPALLKIRLAAGARMMPSGTGEILFLLTMLAFLIRLAVVPFHTWLVDAHVEGFTPSSMFLASLLVNLGGYGIFRVAYPLFPDAGRSLWMIIALIGVGTIIYGALCAWGETHLKRTIAFSSVSHMGFVVLGAAMLTPAAVNGALFMMISNGITSAMMFFVGAVICDRIGHCDLSRLGGLETKMPYGWGLSTVAFLADMGLSGLCGFVGQVMVLLGTFQAAGPSSILRHAGATEEQIYPLAIIASCAMVLTASSMLRAMQQVFFGSMEAENSNVDDLHPLEITVLATLAVMAILLGILPSTFLFGFINQTVGGWLKLFG